MNDNRMNEIIDNINSNPTPSKETVDEFIKNNLTSSQAQAVKNVLKNPQLLKNIMQSPQAKELLERFIKQKREE